MRPRVSLLLATTDDATLLRTVASLCNGQGDRWQLVVSPGPTPLGLEARATVDRTLGKRVAWAAAGAPDAPAALQAAFDAATGEYVGILGPGDEVEPGVLPALIDYLVARPTVDVLYTDEQWPGPGAEGVVTKPGWVPHYLEGWDYLGRLCLIRRSTVVAAGGIRSEHPGACEWDLHLRVTERTEAIEHVPAIGVTRPVAPRTDATANEAGRRAVEARYLRRGVDAHVEIASSEGFVRVWRAIPQPAPVVSIVVPTGGGTRMVRGDRIDLLERCLTSLVERTTYPSWELILVPSAGTPPAAIATAERILGDRLVVAPAEGAFSFSYSVNEGVRHAHGELVLLLNDDTEVIEPRWLERMVGVAQDPTVGAVGAKLYFDDLTIQHVGVIHDDSWSPHHAHRTEVDGIGHFGSKLVDMDYPAVTGACLLTRTELYVAVGGFSRLLPLAYNDVDFCHKITTAGLAVVSTPFARLYHYESSSRAPDVRNFERAYHEEHLLPFAMQDPYVNYRSVR